MIEDNVKTILGFLASHDEIGKEYVTGPQIKETLKIEHEKHINSAIEIAKARGLVHCIVSLGCAPYTFSQVKITAEGRLWLEKNPSL